jgi:hypothetical protein
VVISAIFDRSDLVASASADADIRPDLDRLMEHL